MSAASNRGVITTWQPQQSAWYASPKGAEWYSGPGTTTVSPGCMPSAGGVWIEHRLGVVDDDLRAPGAAAAGDGLHVQRRPLGHRLRRQSRIPQGLLAHHRQAGLLRGTAADDEFRIEQRHDRLQLERWQSMRNGRRRCTQHPAGERDFDERDAVRQRDRDVIALHDARELQRSRQAVDACGEFARASGSCRRRRGRDAPGRARPAGRAGDRSAAAAARRLARNGVDPVT